VLGPPSTLLDPCFGQVRPAGLRVVVVAAGELSRLAEVIAGGGEAGVGG
jgi:hypothetical protein